MTIGYPYNYKISSKSVNSDLLNNLKVSDYVHLVESKESKKKSKRFDKKIKRFFGKRKFSKLNKKILEFQKYSLICFIGNPENPAITPNGEKGLIELFLMCVKQSWDIFLKFGGLVIKSFMKFSKNCVMSLVKIAMRSPWMITFGAFASCALLLFHYLAKRFGRKIQWYHYLLVTILSLIVVCLLGVAIKTEAFKTIREWIKSILVTLLLALRNINSSITEHIEDLQSHSSPIEEKSEPSKADDFKTFVFFSVLTVITTRYLLVKFKRKLVGDGPFTDIIIEIIDNDLPDLPAFLTH